MIRSIESAVRMGAAVLLGLCVVPQSSFAQTAATTATHIPGSFEVEVRTRAYFADIPVMVEIARCESEFRQYNSVGTVLRGGWGGNMLGVFQFNGPVHLSTATALGYDLTTLAGNLGYARYVYEQSGTTPWNSSSDCWAVPAATIGSETDAQLLARIAELLALIEQLQTLLAAQQLAVR